MVHTNLNSLTTIWGLKSRVGIKLIMGSILQPSLTSSTSRACVSHFSSFGSTQLVPLDKNLRFESLSIDGHNDVPTFQSSPTSITFHRTLYLCLLHHCFSLGLPSLPYGCYHRIWGMHVSGLCQVHACLPLELSQIRYPVFVSSHALKNDPSPLPFIGREVPHLHWNRVMDFPTNQTRSSTINDEWHRSDVVWTERYSTLTYNKDLHSLKQLHKTEV